jgi:outer membrane protein OmpA-like peptidoglycan-associated protein
MQERPQAAPPPDPRDVAAGAEAPGRPRVVLGGSVAALALFIVLGAARQAPLVEQDIRERASAAFSPIDFPWARLLVDGRDLTVLGEAPSAAARNAAYRLAAGLEGVRLVRNRTTLRRAGTASATAAPPAPPAAPAPLSPYRVLLRSDGSQLTLAGEVPDSPETETLLARARTRFTIAAVRDELYREPRAAPGAWADAAGTALEALVLLEQGEARIDASQVSVTGVAADAGLRARTRRDLLHKMPAGFASTAQISLAAAPDTTVQGCRRQIDSLLRAAAIEFDGGSAELRPESLPIVEELVEIAQRCDTLRLEIAGHTDDRGGARDNLSLSQRRAEAVMEHLARRGVPLRRLSARGYGEERPVARGTSPEARARNRRIEIHLQPAGS